jgi:hypothetical protein
VVFEVFCADAGLEGEVFDLGDAAEFGEGDDFLENF